MSAVQELVVRRATSGDLEGIERLERASFSDPWDRDAIHAALTLPHMKAWVAERGDGAERHLVGYVIGLMLGGEAEVADIAVAPEQRGSGAGGVLLDHLLAESVRDGVSVVFLEVREGNAAARGLYASRSFREVGRRKGYYHHPLEDALVLRRDLAPSWK